MKKKILTILSIALLLNCCMVLANPEINSYKAVKEAKTKVIDNQIKEYKEQLLNLEANTAISEATRTEKEKEIQIKLHELYSRKEAINNEYKAKKQEIKSRI